MTEWERGSNCKKEPYETQVKADVEKRVSDVLQRTRELESQLEQARTERRQVS